MKINFKIDTRKVSTPSRNKLYYIGGANDPSEINDLLNVTEITIVDNYIPIIQIDVLGVYQNFLLPDFEYDYDNLPTRGEYNFTYSDLIPLSGDSGGGGTIPTLDQVLTEGNESPNDIVLEGSLDAGAVVTMSLNTPMVVIGSASAEGNLSIHNGLGTGLAEIKSSLLTTSRQFEIPDESGIFATRDWVTDNVGTVSVKPFKFVGGTTYNTLAVDKNFHVRTNGTLNIVIDNNLFADNDELRFSVLGNPVQVAFTNGDSLDPLNTLIIEESGTATFKRMDDGNWIMMR